MGVGNACLGLQTLEPVYHEDKIFSNYIRTFINNLVTEFIQPPKYSCVDEMITLYSKVLENYGKRL